MPRAQRTKSAVHEALQRRAGERPGDSFSGLLGGLNTFAPLAPCASYASPEGPQLLVRPVLRHRACALLGRTSDWRKVRGRQWSN
jgi:hypothetical protein